MRCRFAMTLALVAAACGDSSDRAAVEDSSETGTGSPSSDTSESSTGDPMRPDELPPLPSDADPCVNAGLWPDAIHSESLPVTVHYRGRSEQSEAERTLDLVEVSWRIEIDQLGFRPPPPDGGACGGDDDLDVFLWKGWEETYVSPIGGVPDTTWNDRLVIMVVDPFGAYGGDVLPATIAHELNHACQAADDWWDAPIAYEMTATFVEDLVFDDANDYEITLADFQAHPDWSLDRDDGYQTWFMYGAALYLHFVREEYFGGDAGFVSDMWLGMRNPPGDNEPDFADSLHALLLEQAGVGYHDSIPAFARWRYYSGARDDGDHFSEADLVPDVAIANELVGGGDLELDAQMLGSRYVQLRGEPSEAFSVDLDTADDTRWVVQAVPGLADDDGEVLDLAGGPAAVSLDGSGERTIILTALPNGADDPDTRNGQRHDVTLRVW